MAYTEIDLATCTMRGSTTYSGGVISDSGGYPEFALPVSMVLAAGGSYEIVLDYTSGFAGTNNIRAIVYSVKPDLTASSNYELALGPLTAAPQGQTGSFTLPFGAGLDQFDQAITAGETRIDVMGTGGIQFTGARISGLTTGPAPIETASAFANYGYSYTGRGEVTYDPPIAPTPAHIRRAKVMRVHQSIPAPTLVDGRPV